MSDPFATPWAVTHQTPLFLGFLRQEYWSGLPFPSPGDLPDPGIKPTSPHWQADLLLLSHQGSSGYVDVCLVTQFCLTLGNPKDCSLPGSSANGYSPGKNNGVGCHAFLQGIFPTQELNPGLPHCQHILCCLSYQGSPCMWILLY